MGKYSFLKTFRTKVVVHIVFLIILMLIAYFISQSSPSLVAYFILIIVAGQIVLSLFRLVNKTNNDLANFLLSIRYDDFETTYTQTTSYEDSKRSLYKAFNLITDKFRDLRSEQEIQHQFMSAIVEHVDTGLLCFDESGRTVLMNKALKGILHKSFFPTMESVKKFSTDLYEGLNSMNPGENRLIRVESDLSILQLAIVSTVLKMERGELRLFVIQNINEQLEQQEMASWQKLIRILTHEIMNSVSPVVSLTGTTDDIVRNAENLDKETRKNLHLAIQTIQNRSKSLLSFTEKYRQLARIPAPEFEELNLSKLLKELCLLHKPDFSREGIQLDLQLPNRDVVIQADPSLLEQAIINLFKNALDALTGMDKPVFEIRLFKDGEESVTQFADNGPGMDSSMLEKIFIPFFTTKEKGSGIGLSLCRQIVLMHKGSIHVKSEKGKGTVFTLRL